MLETLYGDIREVGRTFHPLARDEYNNLPIYVLPQSPGRIGGSVAAVQALLPYGRSMARSGPGAVRKDGPNCHARGNRNRGRRTHWKLLRLHCSIIEATWRGRAGAE